MCGRFNLITNSEQLALHFGLATVPEPMVDRYNIAPTQPVAAVRNNRDGERELSYFHWGLIPSWAKDAKFGARMINARSETVHEKPSFRAAFKRRRCLVPMTGFYEWQKIAPRKKQPIHITVDEGAIFVAAGLWETWQGIESLTVLTGEPNDLMEPIHNRMPIILDSADFDLWLDTAAPLPAVQSLFKPYDQTRMQTQPVSTYVSKATNEGPACIAPLM